MKAGTPRIQHQPCSQHGLRKPAPPYPAHYMQIQSVMPAHAAGPLMQTCHGEHTYSSYASAV